VYLSNNSTRIILITQNLLYVMLSHHHLQQTLDLLLPSLTPLDTHNPLGVTIFHFKIIVLEQGLYALALSFFFSLSLSLKQASLLAMPLALIQSSRVACQKAFQ
jgi:hypothetical protein